MAQVIRAIFAHDILLAEDFQEFAAVIGKHIDLAESLIDNPDFLVWIIGADANAVRPRAFGAGTQEIPVIPQFFDIAIAIERIHAVLPGAQFAALQHIYTQRACVLFELGRQREWQ